MFPLKYSSVSMRLTGLSWSCHKGFYRLCVSFWGLFLLVPPVVVTVKQLSVICDVAVH